MKKQLLDSLETQTNSCKHIASLFHFKHSRCVTHRCRVQKRQKNKMIFLQIDHDYGDIKAMRSKLIKETELRRARSLSYVMLNTLQFPDAHGCAGMLMCENLKRSVFCSPKKKKIVEAPVPDFPRNEDSHAEEEEDAALDPPYKPSYKTLPLSVLEEKEFTTFRKPHAKLTKRHQIERRN